MQVGAFCLKVDALAKIGVNASKEAAVEQSLIQVRTAWNSVAITITPYKNTGTYIVSGLHGTQVCPNAPLNGTNKHASHAVKGYSLFYGGGLP